MGVSLYDRSNGFDLACRQNVWRTLSHCSLTTPRLGDCDPPHQFNSPSFQFSFNESPLNHSIIMINHPAPPARRNSIHHSPCPIPRPPAATAQLKGAQSDAAAAEARLAEFAQPDLEIDPVGGGRSCWWSRSDHHLSF